MRSWQILLTLIILSSITCATQVIVLNDTVEDLFGIDKIEFSGDLATNNLKITGSGEILSGQDVKVYLVGPADEVLIEDITVSGVEKPVSFDKRGYFFVMENGSFDFTGQVKIRTPGQVKLFIPGPVNEVKFNIKNGYPIGGNIYGVFDREVIIQRVEKTAMLTTGSFKYSYEDRRNSFYYLVDYKAFGDSLGQTKLFLRNGENILDVSGAKDYSIQGKMLVLELEGSEAHVSVTGTFNNNRIQIPLEEGRHHVLVESDPEKKISISTTAKEVDVSESPLRPTFSNSRVFLAGPKDVISVTVKTLGMYPSLAASVSYGTNKIAITEKGSMLGELNYRYSNTGVDYIELAAPGIPLYASTQRGPVKLTKEGNLLLALPKTKSGNLDMIYFNTTSKLGLINKIDVPVVNTMMPVTTQQTQIYLPPDYIVLETFGAKGGSEIPQIETLILFIVLIGGLGWGVKDDKKFMANFVIFMAALAIFDVKLFMVGLIVSIILTIKRYISKDALKWMIGGAMGLIAIGMIFSVMVGFLGVFSMGSSSKSVASIEADYMMVQEEAAAPMAKSMSTFGRGAGAISVPTREGVLPVRLELPRLGKTITVTNHLVRKENPVEIQILIISKKLKYLLYIVGIFTGLYCRKMLKQNTAG